MSILAGAFSLRAGVPLPQALRASLRANISRADKETIIEQADERCYLAKVDLGVWDGSGIHADAQGSFTAVAGEPLLRDGEDCTGWHRGRDVAAMHPRLAQQDWAVLKDCRGTFCGMHYNAEQGSFAVFGDRIGVRPLYLWVGPDFAVFATALRVLEAVEPVRKELDVRGVVEIAAFNYALAERTPYKNIRMLKASEVVHIAGGKARYISYAEWKQEAPLPHEAAVQRTYDAFMSGLRRRMNGGTQAAAFLSGGLDSRAIIGGLTAVGAQVHTVNFAPDGTQDQVFATMAAELLKTRHTQLATDDGNVLQGYRRKAVKEWLDTEFSAADKPRMMWSGDGGSVALGHVYMNPQTAADMERGDTDAALRRFYKGFAARILSPSVRKSLKNLPLQGALEELQAVAGNEAGRAFHLFLMFNDQRRHMAHHFEDLDLDRMEFQLPFFDGEFLDSILHQPVRPYLGHAFYMDWLDKFPNGLGSVPWQAYPGHVQCTLPKPEGLRYQWDTYYEPETIRAMQRRRADKARAVLLAGPFPRHLLSRSVLQVAILVTRMGWRDYSYLIDTASTFHKYWSICGRETSAPRI